MGESSPLAVFLKTQYFPLFLPLLKNPAANQICNSTGNFMSKSDISPILPQLFAFSLHLPSLRNNPSSWRLNVHSAPTSRCFPIRRWSTEADGFQPEHKVRVPPSGKVNMPRLGRRTRPVARLFAPSAIPSCFVVFPRRSFPFAPF